MIISNVYNGFSENNIISHSSEKFVIKQKISNIAKKIFNYLAKNQVAFSVSVLSYMCIQTAAENFTPTIDSNYIYDVYSCRNTLCELSDNYSTEHGSRIPSIEITCGMPMASYYTFHDCIDDICRYSRTIGEKFYACIPNTLEESESSRITNKKDEITEIFKEPIWDEICPKRRFHHISPLHQLGYVKNCIEKICGLISNHNITRGVYELCHHQPITRLHSTLTEIKNGVRALRESTSDTNSLEVSNIIVGITSGLAGIISGTATVASILISYQKAQRMAITLADSIKAIADSTTENAISLVGQSARRCLLYTSPSPRD